MFKTSVIKLFFLFIIIFLIFAEMDRRFNSKNGGFIYPIKYYYYDALPLPLLGFYNTIVRITNPSHTHYFDSYKFKSDHIIKDNFLLIKEEALQLYNNKNLINMKDLSEYSFNRIDAEENLWKVYVLKWYNTINKKAQLSCPNTCKVIEQCKDIHAAMFSILEPGKIIPPHKGPSTACLRYHLGIQIPKDITNCYIMVNNEKFYWKNGESLIFDDTYVHSVNNNTNEPRIILFIDILRPTNEISTWLTNFILSFNSINHFIKQINDNVENKQQ